MLSVKDLCFSYGERPALSGVSLEAGKGEVLCVMGPNGSGKSTLIDCVMGLHPGYGGSISLEGKDIRRCSRREIARQVAYVPQNHSPTFPYTVREVVMMGRTAYLSAFGTPSDGGEELCEHAMRRVGILDLADKPYNTISGGELRLVILARALCQDTPLILMDEPTAHLDYRNELVFLEIVSELCLKDGISVLIATHSPDQAFYFESHGVPVSAMFLKKGVTAAAGRPSDIITASLLEDVYGVRARILESDGEKTILLQRSL